MSKNDQVGTWSHTGTCKICLANVGRDKLTEDHIPPKGIDKSSVQINAVFQAEKKSRESQNGAKFKTICASCNSLLGSQYDPSLIALAQDLKDALSTESNRPRVLQITTQPQRIFKSVLGHLLAHKLHTEHTRFDNIARKYVLNAQDCLPETISIYCWLMTDEKIQSKVIRDFALIPVYMPTGQEDEYITAFQLLKFYPLAFLVSEKEQFRWHENLNQHRNEKLNAEVTLNFDTWAIHPNTWPEDPQWHSLMVGQSGMEATVSWFKRG